MMSMSSVFRPQQIIPHIEKSRLDIGFMGLTDSAPMILAAHLGFFSKWGLSTQLHLQQSWATLRDKLHANTLDAAQLLAPMPLASSLGLHGAPFPLLSALNLSAHGNAITLSNHILDEIRQNNHGTLPDFPLDAGFFAPIIEARRAQHRQLKFGVVYPFSCHYYQLMDWFTQANISLENDIQLHIVSPNHMTKALMDNSIDGFCVGAPWNSKAVRAGLGSTVITSCDIWPDMPEKVLAVSQSWQQAHPYTYIALTSAIKEACDWLNYPPNRFEAAIILSQPQYLHESINNVAPALLDSCLTTLDQPPRHIADYLTFVTGSEQTSTPEQGQYILTKMQEAGQIPEHLNTLDINAMLHTVYQPDLLSSLPSKTANILTS